MVVSVNDPNLLGRGVYDVSEVARLVRRSPDEVVRWASATQDRDALLVPRRRRLLSFYDLITAWVVAELRRRDVPLSKIRDTRRTLTGYSGLDWPLAHFATLDRLATVGSDVYALLGEWVDASRGGQAAFQEVVEPLLHRLDFDDEGMAAVWHPAPGVVVDPLVQAGAPCIEGTRIATELVAELVSAGESVDDVARDYALDPDSVHRALAFERTLRAA